jgi:hypothetical protein
MALSRPWSCRKNDAAGLLKTFKRTDYERR